MVQQQKARGVKGSADTKASAVPATTAKGEKLKGELDELLDEIDEVLEENAADFVRDYIQKGGQ